VWQAFYFAEAILLWDVCRRRGVRHLHAHHINQAADAAMLACSFARGRMTWSFTMHGPNEFYEVRHFGLARKVAAAQAVACISDFCRSQVMAHVDPAQWGKLTIVHCGVNPEEYVPAPRPEGDGPVEVLCVGRLVPVKGQRLLIDAAERLVGEGSTSS